MKQKLKDKLDRLEALNIIGKVSEPTEWVNAMVMVEKKDESHYPIPTFEDATEDLHGISTVSKLDVRSGYWILPLTERSSFYTTFSTVFGRYRWKRYPFGLVSAQNEFQRQMDEIFEGLEGIRILIDNILVYGKSQEEHENRLCAVLKRAREKGVRFNQEKCTFGMEQVKYSGHIISKEGIKPDPEKLNAIKKMPSPTTKEELQTLLGMLNFLSQYIPSLSSRNKTLRDLIQEVEFEWKPHHEECFSAIKQSITDNLAFFDHSSRTVDLKVDASKHGLGTEISTNGNMCGYASRALSKTEQNYSQLKKEMYTIVYRLKHFHHYIYGERRLQRMMIQTLPYDLEVIYIPGSDIPVADALSRLSLPNTDFQMQRDIKAYVHSVMKTLPVSNSKLRKIRQLTKHDKQLSTLQSVIQHGWPSI
ncbi:hypothetical protein QYM36_008013 [Artemia franciscana]|uniref:Reverse transcriptase domain-containing protein n=1 Tax=Artemia franciscana TaxID=6661 RepID=A0AA88LEB1_ARTSF|nr:hypothetical protein QYM36_008013 [Artemia franciscana]